jgi:hypothetical protein
MRNPGRKLAEINRLQLAVKVKDVFNYEESGEKIE